MSRNVPGWSSSLPTSLRHDGEIREDIERSVTSSEAEVLLMTACLGSAASQALLNLRLDWPFKLPSRSDEGSNCRGLKNFVFDAFEALQNYHGGEDWGGEWFIAPYFSFEEDGRSLRIGVFDCSDIEVL